MEIKLPVKWLESKGIELLDEDGRCRSKVNGEVVEYVYGFVYRRNTGEQPVKGWVPVDTLDIADFEDENSIASSIDWVRPAHLDIKLGYICKWKPNAEELMKMYKDEPSWDMLINLVGEPEIKLPEIKLSATWLVSKGIKISPDDDWYNGGYEKVSEEIANLLNSGSTISGFITAFADRENAGVRPVGDWVPIQVKGQSLYEDSDVAGAYCFLVGGADIDLKTWKPDDKALMEIYTAEQNAIKESGPSDDLISRMGLDRPNNEYGDMIVSEQKDNATEIDNTANVYGVEQPTMVSDAVKAFSEKVDEPTDVMHNIINATNSKVYSVDKSREVLNVDFEKSFTKFGIIDKKETKLKLTKDDVGKEFKTRAGEVVTMVYSVECALRFCFETELSGLYVTNEKGKPSSGVVADEIIKRHEPRYWLKDLPDADAFSESVSCITCNYKGWYVSKGSSLMSGEYVTNKMPQLTRNDYDLSKISIDDLREWQRVNK